jgi:hypothetical protein
MKRGWDRIENREGVIVILGRKVLHIRDGIWRMWSPGAVIHWYGVGGYLRVAREDNTAMDLSLATGV